MADLADTDAERAALAAIAEEGRILGPARALRTLEATSLSAEDFTDSTHRAFFLVAESAIRAGRALVAAVFDGALRGFLPILREQEAVSAAQLGTLAEHLRELTTRRQAWEAAKRIQAAAEDRAVSVSALVGRFSQESTGLSTRGSHWETLDAAVDEARARIDRNQDGLPSGAVKSGYRDLDDVTGGFPPTLCVICGQPGMAKTGVVLSCIRNQAQRGERPAIFAMEDGKAALAFRWLAHEARLSNFALKFNKLSAEGWSALGYADATVRGWPAPPIIDGRQGLRPTQILMAAREAIRRYNARIIYLDNMTAVKFTRGPRMDLEIQDFLTDARALAIEESVPFVVVAHAKRREGLKPGEIPLLTDCRESAAFENLSRMALGIGRDLTSDKIDVGVLKNTDGPPGIRIALPFRDSSTLLEQEDRR